MEIKRTKIELKEEKQIAIGCIMNELFLKSIQPLLQDITLLSSPYIRTVLQWCFTYYKAHSEAPGYSIKDLFEYNKGKLQEQSEIDAIELLLLHLSETYTEEDVQFNYKFEFEKAENYLKKQSLKKLAEKINGAVASDNPETAEEAVATYKRIEKVSGYGVDIFRDPTIADEIVEIMQKPLLRIDGDFGLALGPVRRGDLITVQGAMKKGKSYLAQALLFYGLVQNLNISIFTLEMSRAEYSGRLFQDFLGVRATDRGDRPIKIPYFDAEGNILYKTIPQGHLTKAAIVKMQNKLQMQYTSQLRVYDITTGAASKSSIEATLEKDYTFDNFKPDLLLIDYVDIMEDEYGESRDDLIKEANRMKWAKQLSQKWGFVTISPMQGGRGSSNGDSDHNNTAGSIHKLDAVTHNITINQTPEEKAAQIVKLKFMGRKNDFEYGDVLVTQCLDIGRAIVKHRFLKNVANYQEIIAEGGLEWGDDEGGGKNGTK